MTQFGTFSLTPAHSRWERENHSLRNPNPQPLRMQRGSRTRLPLPAGGPGCTAVELSKLPGETCRLLPLLPQREERAGERRAARTSKKAPLPNPLPVRRGEGEHESDLPSFLNSTAVGPERGRSTRMPQMSRASCCNNRYQSMIGHCSVVHGEFCFVIGHCSVVHGEFCFVIGHCSVVHG